MFLEPHNRILIQRVNSRTVGGLSPRFQNRISLIFHSIPETNQVDAIYSPWNLVVSFKLS